MRNIKSFNFKNKRVLVRCDFNVPLDEKGAIKDDFKIKQSLPTIEFLLQKQARIILMSHLDNPEGKFSTKLSLAKIGKRLEKLLKVKVTLSPDCVGRQTENLAGKLKPKEILLLENLRFHKEEKANNLNFAKKIAKIGDIYVNDGFAECHRNYASVVQLPKLLPSAAGLLLQKEIENLNKILQKPKRPLIVLMGGAKVKTKVNFIKKISESADFVLIGNLLEKEIVTKHLRFENLKKIMDPVGQDFKAKDLDKETLKAYKKIILQAKTIFWNGPFGKFEDKRYKKGTLQIAKTIIKSGAFSVAGGGETVEFLNREKLTQKFNHASTGGGAMLAYLSGEKLPGLEALR